MRQALHVVLLLTLAGAGLAGCLTLPTAPVDAAGHATAPLAPLLHLPGALPATPPPGLAAASAVWRGLGQNATEPTLGLTSTGAIFVAAAGPGRDATGRTAFFTDVLRSRDAGLSWEDVTPRVGGFRVPPTTGDPYVYVDPATDRVFSLDMFPGLACSTLSWSDDGGDTWTTQPVACGTPPPYDHQTMTAGKPRVMATAGYPNVLYQCVNRFTDSICMRSPNGGLSWIAGGPAFLGVSPGDVGPDTAATGAGFCGGLHGHVVAAPDGTVYLPRRFCDHPYLAVSADDATTWKTVKVADVKAAFGPDPAVAVDAAGNVYYLFIGVEGLLHLAVSTDGGTTFGEPLVVSAPGVTAAHLPAIDAGDDGRIAFVYAGTENLPGGYLNPEFEEPTPPRDGDIAASTWNGYLAVVTNALDGAGMVIQTVRVNDPADPLVRGPCGPGRCPGMYDFIDVVIGPEGRPYAVFVDACVGACATPEGTMADSQGAKQGRAGALVALARGPALRGEDPLPLLTGVLER